MAGRREERPSSWRTRAIGEATGAVADLGVFVPLATALVLVCGLDAGAVLVCAGLLLVVSGAVFRIPFPVQPLKALSAVAIATGAAPGVINAAGIEIGLFLILLSVDGMADRIARAFTQPIVRALQLGLGLLLIRSAAGLVSHPPEVFAATPRSPWPVILAVAVFACVVWAARRGRYGIALLWLAGGTLAAVVTAGAGSVVPSFSLPGFDLPQTSQFAAAFFLLVVPQLPLTFGNAVVAVTDVARNSFGVRARRVTPSRVCVTAGVGNVLAGLLGGAPMCHGAGGLSAHVRLGARTAAMNLGLGGVFLALGLFFAQHIPTLLGLLPVWVLAAFLAYAGLRHALLAADQRGSALAIALVAGLTGAATQNLGWSLALGLAATHGRRLRRRPTIYALTGDKP